MGWLIEMLIEGIQEKCSQFIIDMMEVITEMFTELLSCNLSLFEELFSVVGALYKSMVVPLAVALLLLILTWQLFKSMFGKAGLSGEDPMELVFRSGACLFMIVGAKSFINYVLTIAGTPYQWVVGTDIKVNSFSEYVSSLEGVTAVLGIDNISTMLLTLIMQLVVAWNYFKMLFIVAERYVLLGVFSYTAPLAFATGGSKATNNILSSWAKMFGGQIVLIIMNAWCMKMFLSGYGNMLASGYGFTKFFVATLCLIGFCKITFKLDTYMASLGVNLGRPSGGMGAMGLVMAANRIFSSFRGASSGGSQPSGGSAMEHESGSQMGTRDMTNGFTQPIPMSSDEKTVSGGTETEKTEAEHTEMEDAGTVENEAYESQSDSVLEILGEMPSEHTDEEGMSDAHGSSVEAGQSEDISQMQEVLENGSGNVLIGNGFEDHTGTVGDENVPGQDIVDENSEGSLIEVLNQGNDIDGIGDYPVRRNRGLGDQNEEAPLDMENAVIGEPIETEEAKTGSAGTDYSQSLSSRRFGGNAEQAQDIDILQELGASSQLDVSVSDGTAAGGSTLNPIKGMVGNVDKTGNSSQTTGGDTRLPDSDEFGENRTERDGLSELVEKGTEIAVDSDSQAVSEDALNMTSEDNELPNFNPENVDYDMDVPEPVPETIPRSIAEGRDAIHERGFNGENSKFTTRNQERGRVITDGPAENLTDELMNVHKSKGFEASEASLEDVPETIELTDSPKIGNMDDEETFPL